MASWIACPSCALRHSARGDGLCPRCHAAVAPAVAAPEPPPPPPTGSQVGAALAGPVVAGALPAAAAGACAAHAPGTLLAVGAALFAFGASNLVRFGLQGGVETAVVVAAILDVLLGGALVAAPGRRELIWAAVLRAGAGLAAGAGSALLLGERLAGSLQILLAAGVLLALLGRSRTHLLAGSAAAAAAAGANALALATLLGSPGQGAPAAGAVAWRLSSEEPPTWSIALPGAHWLRVAPGSDPSPPPGADAMVVWREKEAYVAVTARSAAEHGFAGPSLSFETGRLLQETGRRVARLERLSEAPLGTQLEASLIRARGEVGGREIALMFAVAVFDEGTIELAGRCPVQHAGAVWSEFVTIARSLSRDPRAGAPRR